MTREIKGALTVVLLVVAIIFHASVRSSAVLAHSYYHGLLQVFVDEEEQYLSEVFPQAESFSPKEGNFPHYKAYKVDPQSGRDELIGFAFLTSDIEPLEWGYEGPIIILVGMTMEGVITGIKVIDHHEPYGNISIDPPSFAEQFKDKSILDRFRVGGDIDAIGRATITISAATRAIKKSARRIAKRYIVQGSDEDHGS